MIATERVHVAPVADTNTASGERSPTSVSPVTEVGLPFEIVAV